MSITEIQDFINFKRFVIVISTNLEPSYQHETVVLAYDFRDILNGRYSEFWSKYGGYKENLILFPDKNIKITWINPTNRVDKIERTFYKYIPDYVNYVQNIKSKDEQNKCLESEEHYDPNHMYYRYHNFGTCVEGALTNIHWNCKWNDISINGFTVRNRNVMKKFGTVMTFDEFIDEIIRCIDSGYVKEVIKEVEVPKKIELSTVEMYKLDNYDKLIQELEHIKEENSVRQKLIDDLTQTNKNNIAKINEVKETYQKKLDEERKVNKKVENKRERTANNHLQTKYNELNEKYLKDVEKYENVINDLKHRVIENKNEEEKVKIVHEKVVKYYLNDILWFIVVISILFNVGFLINMYLHD